MKRGLSQEALKTIACICMLLDHIGAALVPCMGLRLVGRLAFPIYCFLLTQGARHTHSPRRYLLRLAIGAALSELPFDLLFFGTPELGHQNVMLTLLLGLGMLLALRRMAHPALQVLCVALAVGAAELLRVDYGGLGVLLIALFAQSGGNRLVITLGAGAIFLCMGGPPITVAGLPVPLEVFALLALPLIFCYHGEKRTASRAVQWGFYLFYPLHLTLLLLISRFFHA